MKESLDSRAPRKPTTSRVPHQQYHTPSRKRISRSMGQIPQQRRSPPPTGHEFCELAKSTSRQASLDSTKRLLKHGLGLRMETLNYPSWWRHWAAMAASGFNVFRLLALSCVSTKLGIRKRLNPPPPTHIYHKSPPQSSPLHLSI